MNIDYIGVSIDCIGKSIDLIGKSIYFVGESVDCVGESGVYAKTNCAFFIFKVLVFDRNA